MRPRARRGGGPGSRQGSRSTWRWSLLWPLIVVALVGGGCGQGAPGSAASNAELPPGVAVEPTPAPAWRLVWNDEFDGAAGNAVDPTRWTASVGGGGWGQDELDYATNCTDPLAPHFTTANAQMDGEGNLVLAALEEEVAYDSCWYGPCRYTSARLETSRTLLRQHGRFEARAKTPPGRGLWPAFWLVGLEIREDYWGEIDLMEVIEGRFPRTVFQAAHGPGFTSERVSDGYAVPGGQVSDEFHVYAVEWFPERLDYFVDGQPTLTVTPDSLPGGVRWPFDDQPFYMLMNLGVGSRTSWSGTPDQTTPFPARLLVDYVRVFERE